MTKLTAVLAALVLAVSATAVVPEATACGGYGGAEPVFQPERARGRWPSIVRATASEGGARTVELELHYPRYQRSGDLRYVDRLTVVDDPRLRGLEQRLARPDAHRIVVAVEEVEPGLWRVTGWDRQPSPT